MIGRLKGKVCFSSDDYLILDVSGVGYKVHCSNKALSNLSNNSFTELFIETHVREDQIKLYGFLSIFEQEYFNTLQSVKGVGGKMALAILSQLSPDQISLALASKDSRAFQNISGVGKKLSERIITELKDKFISTSYNSASGISLSGGSGISPSENGTSNNSSSALIESDTISDAVSALVNLGINRSDAYSRVTTVIKNYNKEASNGDQSLSESGKLDINTIIKLSLQNTYK